MTCLTLKFLISFPRNIPLVAVSQDTVITGRKQAPTKLVSHTSWNLTNRHRVWTPVFFFFVIPISVLDHVKTYVHEAGCVECKRLLNFRLSWLPTFIHIQAQTGRQVRLGVCIIIKHTSLLTSRAGEFCQTNYWQAATTTAREKTHRSQAC